MKATLRPGTGQGRAASLFRAESFGEEEIERAANPPLTSRAHDTKSPEEAWRLTGNLAAVDEERRPCSAIESAIVGSDPVTGGPGGTSASELKAEPSLRSASCHSVRAQARSRMLDTRRAHRRARTQSGSGGCACACGPACGVPTFFIAA